jgi:pullulanase-type alpha-1,6-glucosidase
MMARLMQDTLVRWADQYKVDGFRFDIMGFTPLATVQSAKTAVDAVMAVDGRGKSLFYGEGWNFGHAANDALFVQATQLNLAGSGIGSFNDRVRDAVRGGGPFDSGASLVTNQGFVNGLCYDNNDASACTAGQRNSLQYWQNLIRLSLAGNLKDYKLNGTLGSAYNYGGQPAGYTQDPTENVPYVSVHDNETLFDISQYKHPAATGIAARARAQVVGLSLVALSQGIAFFHAGDDLLRSKSMDSNSYNSGDYFNRIFWDGSANNFGVGAPPQNTGNNVANLATATPILGQPAPAQSDNLNASAALQDFLKIRKDTSMFRLGTGALVKSCVSFPDAAAQQDGLIVMRIAGPNCGDAKYKSIVVLINANKVAQNYAIAAYQGSTTTITLHTAQAGGSDPVVKGATFTPATGTFSVPARTTAVFVET